MISVTAAALCCATFPTDAVVAESAPHAVGTAKKKSHRAPKRVSFFGLRKPFSAFCLRLDADGRLSLWQHIVDRHQEKNPLCIRCEPFFGMLKKACEKKSQRTRTIASKHGSSPDAAAPTPASSPQRLPHLETFLTLQSALKALQALPMSPEELNVLLIILRSELRACRGLTPAACEYLETLATFTDSMVASALSTDSGGAAESASDSPTPTEADVEALFE